jgi:glycerol-3-phosphate dehydrogenase
MGYATRFIGGTKGSHLVLDHKELRQTIDGHEFFFENKDGRIVLIFPLYDRVLVGTSDIAVEDPDNVRCTEEEVDYFLELIKRVFPAIPVDRSHIVFRFSGVRPLASSGSRTTGQITRDHEIQIIPADDGSLAFPIFSLVGGKWTSWRAFSEQAADRCLVQLGIARRSSTRKLRIGGGREYPATDEDRREMLERISEDLGGSAQRAEALFERYGTRAQQIAEFAMATRDFPLRALPTYSHGEIEFMASYEKVVHLDDLVLRRSMIGMLGHATRDGLTEIAGVLAKPLRWAARRQEAEIARTLEILKDRHQLEL